MIEISKEAAEHLKRQLNDVIPIIRNASSSHEQITEILIGLYAAGLNDGNDKAKSLLEQMTHDMASVVIAHLAKDAIGLKAALDTFVQHRCVVTVAGQAAPTRH